MKLNPVLWTWSKPSSTFVRMIGWIPPLMGAVLNQTTTQWNLVMKPLILILISGCTNRCLGITCQSKAKTLHSLLTFLGICLHSGGTHTLELLLIFYSGTIHELPSVCHMTEKVSWCLWKDFRTFSPGLMIIRTLKINLLSLIKTK